MNKIDKTDTLRVILSNRRFTVDVFQREYRWGQKQIEQMLTDFQSTFEGYYDPENHDTPEEVETYGYYYMGCIICTGGTPKKIIDGQQRLTSLTLLLIYLNNLQKKQAKAETEIVSLDDMIFAVHFGKKRFNIDVDERKFCFQALFDQDAAYQPEDESAQNMLDRYRDIEALFPDELKGEALPFFIYWLIEKVLLLEIDTPSEDEAHTIFLTMNDRGLSLNSAEMMKAYIIQQVAESDRIEVNHQWQRNINRIKDTSSYDSSGVVNTEDVEFISAWLRAKYAQTLREGGKGAADKDFELLGEKFHTWVRTNAKTIMGLNKSTDYRTLILTEMTRVTDLYLRIKKYSMTLTPGFEEVFYNANRDLNYQTMMIISAVRSDDTEEDIVRKIQMVSKFVDDFASIRIFNYRKVNWNTNKYMLFRVMREIRDQDCLTVGKILVRELRRLDVSIDGIRSFSLNQFTGRYMLHFLARFTSFVNERMGNPSQFDVYVDRHRKGNTFDIEHILPNDFDTYRDDFASPEDFQTSRQHVGNLIILTRDKNRAYQDMPYDEKVVHYHGDNVLAQALYDGSYHMNPHLREMAEQYGFSPIAHFTKESIAERARIYLQLAVDIWDPNTIKEIAGGWSEEDEQEFFRAAKAQEFTVEYLDRSWPDALRYGFLSADQTNSGRYLWNIQVGDTVYCHIAGSGFVGIGICIAKAVRMKDFRVVVDGQQILITDVDWDCPKMRDRLDREKELFLRVEWKAFVSNPSEGYWEKGMTSVPLVAYTLSDRSTYRKVAEHFGYQA